MIPQYAIPFPAPGGPGKCTLKQINQNLEKEGFLYQMTHEMSHPTINNVAL